MLMKTVFKIIAPDPISEVLLNSLVQIPLCPWRFPTPTMKGAKNRPAVVLTKTSKQLFLGRKSVQLLCYHTRFRGPGKLWFVPREPAAVCVNVHKWELYQISACGAGENVMYPVMFVYISVIKQRNRSKRPMRCKNKHWRQPFQNLRHAFRNLRDDVS